MLILINAWLISNRKKRTSYALLLWHLIPLAGLILTFYLLGKARDDVPLTEAELNPEMPDPALKWYNKPLF
jgi:hypothetical protein